MKEKKVAEEAREPLRFDRFARQMFPFLTVGRFHAAYYRVLEAFARGKIRRLIVTIPPQHGKSLGATTLLPAYMLGLDPELKIAIASYSASLANRFNRRVQRLIDSQAYAALFPETTVKRAGARSEYVRTAVGCYNEAINAYLDGTFGEEKIAGWNERLDKIFNRGFWNGYYLGQRLGEWTSKYGSSATRTKIYAAKGVRYFSNIKVAEFLMEAGELNVGDEILIIGPTTGVIPMTVSEIRVDLKPVQKAVKGDRFSIQVDEKIRPSDKLYVWWDSEKLRESKIK